jgi:hypothetical protein
MKSRIVTVDYARSEWAEALVGRIVMTEAIGHWPGGPAEVIEFMPDVEAPEIPYQVRHIHWAGDDLIENGEIGLFENEEIQIVPYGKVTEL